MVRPNRISALVRLHHNTNTNNDVDDHHRHSVVRIYHREQCRTIIADDQTTGRWIYQLLRRNDNNWLLVRCVVALRCCSFWLDFICIVCFRLIVSSFRCRCYSCCFCCSLVPRIDIWFVLSAAEQPWRRRRLFSLLLLLLARYLSSNEKKLIILMCSVTLYLPPSAAHTTGHCLIARRYIHPKKNYLPNRMRRGN
jgi:hypothetical protein